MSSGRLVRRPRHPHRRRCPRLAVGDLLDESLGSITRRRARSLLTALGTAVGVGVLVATLGLTMTAAHQVGGRFDAPEATEVVVRDTQPGKREPAFPPDALRRVERLSGVRAAGLYWNVTARKMSVRRAAYRDPQGSNVRSLSLLAATPGTLRAAGARVGSGRLYDAGHERRAGRVALLGAAAAQRLGLTRVGHQPGIFIDGEPFTVIGIIGHVDRKPGLLRSVIVPGRTARQVWGGGDARPSMLIDTELGAAKQVGARAPLALRPDAPDRLSSRVPPDPDSLRRGVEGDVLVLLLLLAAVSLVAGAGWVAACTLASVLERAQEIGLRRALGVGRHHIAAQLLTESCLLGGAGGLLGTCGAIIVITVVSAARQWSAVIGPALVLPAPFAGMLIGLAAGAYPALMAARIPPSRQSTGPAAPASPAHGRPRS